MKHISLHQFHPLGLKYCFSEKGFKLKLTLLKELVNENIGICYSHNGYSNAKKQVDDYLFVSNYLDTLTDINNMNKGIHHLKTDQTIASNIRTDRR